ncbi:MULTISPECIES: ABC transporter permease [Streptomyces]|uniref:Transport permease protein n=1 Tax=Streptomyces lycii TaxID=2654337 RepID=A0ABQ7FFN5_9ACTN|nr:MULTISPECIES: ABC transporter permease [Streptomyces]KAF4406783.1 ABC transporter permease [Streptomyces lycii]PGH49876.1 ABC transporter [Streptomyces sp. Ru87]
MTAVATAAWTPRAPARTAALTETLAVAGRRLRHLRRAPGRFLGITLNPLLTMLVLGFLLEKSLVIPGNGSYQEYLFAGAVIQGGLAGVGPTAIAVASDVRGGVIDRFRSMPVSRGAVLFGHTLADFLVGLGSLVVVTGFGLLLGWRPHGSAAAVLAGFGLIAVFNYVMLWVGVLLGLASRSLETISSLTPLVVTVLPFLSSAFLAPQNLPAWLRAFAEWNPVSAVAQACRELWGNPSAAGSGFPAEHPALVIALTLGAVFLLTTVFGLRRYRTVGN